MPKPRNTVRAALLSVALVALQGCAVAADVVVFSTPTLKTSLDEIAPRFEQRTGHRLMVRYDSVAALKRRIEAGDAFGVALLLKSAIDDLAAQGRVDGASATNLARAAVGVAVRAGAPLPDVSSVDALKQTLARARSYAYGADSASGSYFQALLQRLEIPGAAEKLKAVPGGKVMQAVAQGEAELTVITVPNIIGEPGVALAGTLPEALQNYTIFSAAVAAPVSAAVAGGSAAQTFLAFLLTPESAGTFASHGLQRASP